MSVVVGAIILKGKKMNKKKIGIEKYFTVYKIGFWTLFAFTMICSLVYLFLGA